MTVIRKHWRKMAIAVCFTITLVVGVAMATFDHFWIRQSEIEVIRNGQSSPDSKVYRSHNGFLLIKVADDDEWYKFYPNNSHMGWCGI